MTRNYSGVTLGTPVRRLHSASLQMMQLFLHQQDQVLRGQRGRVSFRGCGRRHTPNPVPTR